MGKSMMFNLGTPISSFKVGDRVQRTSYHIIVGMEVVGTVGTIRDIGAGFLEVLWDGHRSSTVYTGSKFNLYFSIISTCQSPRSVLHCNRCGEYNEWAEANQPDGTHRCFQCRKDPWR